MRKTILYLILLLIPLLNNARIYDSKTAKKDTNSVCTILNFADHGLQNEVFNLAYKGFSKLQQDCKLINDTIITIIDYSQLSNKKRLYIIDLKNKKLLFNTYVAHGKNTRDEFAKYFSNKSGSLQSSLGFYITENPVFGKHTGFSLMLNGIEKGINDNASKREIIIHSAEYATENFIKRNGRLEGAGVARFCRLVACKKILKGFCKLNFKTPRALPSPVD